MEEILREILKELQSHGRLLYKINENLIVIRAKTPCGEKGENSEIMRNLQIVAEMFRNTPFGPQMEAALKNYAEGK